MIDIINHRKVSEVETGTYSSRDSGRCTYCGNKSLPLSYKAGIAHQMVCTNCGTIQVNLNNPFLDSKDTEEIGRRKETGMIQTRSGNNDESENHGIEGIKRPKIEPLEHVSDEVIIEPTENLTGDVTTTITRSLNQANIDKSTKERDDKIRLRQLFGRSINNFL